MAASRAAADTLVAIVLVTASAGGAVLLTGAPAAVGTGDAVPFLQRHVRTVSVVMRQDAANQAKGVGEPSLGHCLSQRQGGLAGTQLSILDVRMGHEIVAVGRIGFEGHHVKAPTPRLVSYALPEELDGKWAEVDAFQGDRLGRDDDCPV